MLVHCRYFIHSIVYASYSLPMVYLHFAACYRQKNLMSKKITSSTASLKSLKEHHSNQVTPPLLVPLKRLEQALEIPSAEPVEVVALDNLNEHRRAIEDMLRE